jgi:membrane-bound inhibitor of C-type lysozyme
MIRGIFAAMSVLALSACATAPSPVAADATDAAQTYACAGGKSFTAAYDLQGERASVNAGGRTYSLRQVPAASGVKYAQSGVELHAKGTGAMLDGAAGSPYRDCRTG